MFDSIRSRGHTPEKGHQKTRGSNRELIMDNMNNNANNAGANNNNSNQQQSLLSPGHVVKERWRVVRRIGGGGFGEIFECIDLSNNQQVALKVESTRQQKQVSGNTLPHPLSLSELSLAHLSQCDCVGGVCVCVPQNSDISRLQTTNLPINACLQLHPFPLPLGRSECWIILRERLSIEVQH